MKPLWIALALTACGSSPPAPALAPLPIADAPRASVEDARALLAQIRAREDGLGTWKAVHTLVLDDRANDRHVTLRGVLLVRRPDRFRLRLLGPAGITAMDLHYVAPGYRLEIAGRAPVVRERTERNADSDPRLPVRAMAEAFLRRYDGEAVALRSAGGVQRLTLRPPDGGERTLVVRDDAVAVDSFSRAGRERLRVTYDDPRPVDGRTLPFQVRMDLPEREVTAEVRVERYELEPALPPGAL